MKKITIWLNKVMHDYEEFDIGTKDWIVTLHIEKGERIIFWEAKQEEGEETRSGQLYFDIINQGVRKATQEMREIVEIELVPELGHISNLDDVLKKQVPTVIRKLHEVFQ